MFLSMMKHDPNQLEFLPGAPEPTCHLPAKVDPGEHSAPEDPQTKIDRKPTKESV